MSFKEEFHEIYENRNVLRSLVSRNLFGKYKNSFLGFAWNFFTPLILLAMYYIIFSELRTGETIENKFVFISVAIFGFHFMSSCVTGGTNAFTSNAVMMKKMYVPKEIFVLSKVISTAIICIIGNIITFILMALISYPIDATCTILMIFIIILTFVFGTGCVFLLSTLTVYIRDIQHLIGPMGIALFVLTPMRYMAKDATGFLSSIIYLNPLTYFVEAYHNLMYWHTIPDSSWLLMCVALALGMLLIGYATFRSLKRGFMKRL